MQIFRPILAGAALGDRLAAGVGAALGIALTGLIAARLAGAGALPLLVAPIGASAVLVFAGNTVSAIFGLIVVQMVPQEAIAAALAVGGAIVLMSLLRCLHPPGGAVALIVVLMAGAHQPAGWLFPLVPVGLNSALLVVAAVAFHRWSAHAYPHRPVAMPASSAFAPEDIDAALAEMHETFDIAREDLDALLARAADHAAIRRERSVRSSPRR
jgi:CBS domain-containing membrane protein